MLYPVELRGRFQILHLTRFINFLWSDCRKNCSDSLRTSLLHCAGDLKHIRRAGMNVSHCGLNLTPLLNEEVTSAPAGSGYCTVSVVVVECWVDADLPVTVIV